MPYKRGYGGTKRRRVNGGSGRPFKRRRVGFAGTKRRAYVRRRRVGYRNAPMLRPVKMGAQQPVRMFAKHLLTYSNTTTVTVGAFSQSLTEFFPLEGNDVIGSGIAGTRNFPSNWVAYASIYNTVRIHGIKITAYFQDLPVQNENEVTSCFYSVPGPNDGVKDVDPYAVTTLLLEDNMLQQKGIRKHKVLGAGDTNRVKVAIHNSGYWSIKRIQSELSLDNHVAELEVAPDGTAVKLPELFPYIIHKILPAKQGGFGTASVYQVRYVVTLYADWFSRRRSFDNSFTQA